MRFLCILIKTKISQHTDGFVKTKEASTVFISHILTAQSYHFKFDLFWSLQLANDLFLLGFDTLSHLFVRMFILVPTTAKSTISQSSCFETQNFQRPSGKHQRSVFFILKSFYLFLKTLCQISGVQSCFEKCGEGVHLFWALFPEKKRGPNSFLP